LICLSKTVVLYTDTGGRYDPARITIRYEEHIHWRDHEAREAGELIPPGSQFDTKNIFTGGIPKRDIIQVTGHRTLEPFLKYPLMLFEKVPIELTTYPSAVNWK
jgi:hypothetical protein